MAVTAIHHRPRRGPSPFLRSVSLLALVVAWGAVFGVAYALGSHPSSRSSTQSTAPALATGTDVPASASATLTPSAHRLPVSGLHSLPAAPALRPRVLAAGVVRRPVYHVPVYRPVTVAPTAPATSTSTPTTTPTPKTTGGGPHGSGGTGGGTTTIGGSGGGGMGTGTATTPTTPTTNSTPTPTPPTGG
jgi:hypothetical protein